MSEEQKDKLESAENTVTFADQDAIIGPVGNEGAEMVPSMAAMDPMSESAVGPVNDVSGMGNQDVPPLSGATDSAVAPLNDVSGMGNQDVPPPLSGATDSVAEPLNNVSGMGNQDVPPLSGATDPLVDPLNDVSGMGNQDVPPLSGATDPLADPLNNVSGIDGSVPPLSGATDPLADPLNNVSGMGNQDVLPPPPLSGATPSELSQESSNMVDVAAAAGPSLDDSEINDKKTEFIKKIPEDKMSEFSEFLSGDINNVRASIFVNTKIDLLVDMINACINNFNDYGDMVDALVTETLDTRTIANDIDQNNPALNQFKGIVNEVVSIRDNMDKFGVEIDTLSQNFSTLQDDFKEYLSEGNTKPMILRNQYERDIAVLKQMGGDGEQTMVVDTDKLIRFVGQNSDLQKTSSDLTYKINLSNADVNNVSARLTEAKTAIITAKNADLSTVADPTAAATSMSLDPASAATSSMSLNNPTATNGMTLNNDPAASAASGMTLNNDPAASAANGMSLDPAAATTSGMSLDPAASAASGMSLDPAASGMSLDPAASGMSLDPAVSGMSLDPAVSSIPIDNTANTSGMSLDPAAATSGMSLDPTATAAATTDPTAAAATSGIPIDNANATATATAVDATDPTATTDPTAAAATSGIPIDNANASTDPTAVTDATAPTPLPAESSMFDSLGGMFSSTPKKEEQVTSISTSGPGYLLYAEKEGEVNNLYVANETFMQNNPTIVNDIKNGSNSISIDISQQPTAEVVKSIMDKTRKNTIIGGGDGKKNKTVKTKSEALLSKIQEKKKLAQSINVTRYAKPYKTNNKTKSRKFSQ